MSGINKSRGAQSSPTSQRYNLPEHAQDGDWRDQREQIDGPQDKLRTSVTLEFPKSIMVFNTSPDIPFDRSLNAYRGCEHGCIYCYARPTHAFHDLSPGLDFETKLFAKPQAAQLLRATFARRQYAPKPLALGTNTDPYQPIEKRYRITRQVLEVCLECRHPVTITTKSDRILNDIDLLARLAQANLVAVAISVTSCHPALSRLLEPRASSPAKRLAALQALASAKIPAHCAIAPVIPAITDHEIETIVAAAAVSRARSIGWIPVRLPHEVAPLFREWLDVHYPERARKVMSIIRSMRGGRDNDSAFFTRFRPTGVWADLLRARFTLACKRAGIERKPFHLDCSQFRRPGATGQLSLFDD